MRSVTWSIGVAVALWCVADAQAQEWTRFRGPNGSGISDATTVPVEWSEEDFNWVVQLPGVGNSSPVVWGERLMITSADEKTGRRYVTCIDTRDGRVLWQRHFDLVADRKHVNNSYASSTPAVDELHVYVFWQSREQSPLVALDHDGRIVWQYDLGPFRHGQGGGTSPIVFEDLVVVCNDHGQGSAVVALDRRSGQLRWRIPREGKRACYATPCVYQPPGRPAEIVLSHCYEGIAGVDPATGRYNWVIRPFGTFEQRAIGSPIVVGDLIVANSGAVAGEKNVVAVRPRWTQAGVEVEEVYRISRSAAPHVPTVLAYRDRLFLWSDIGVVTCVDAQAGRRIWQRRVGGNYFGSPICAGGKLYCVDLDGNVVVVAAADQFQLLARNPLGEGSRATPAVSDGTLFVRTYSHVFSIGGPGHGTGGQEAGAGR